MTSVRRTKRWLHRGAILALVIGGLATTACSGGSAGGTAGTESASTFIKRVTTEFSLGQSGRLWDQLLPSDQAIVSRARYTQCQGNQGFRIKDMKVLDTYSDPVDVGGAAPERADAVTVQVTSDDGVTTATVHAISIGGSWHWVLSSADRAAYRAGKCP
jgi:hypothetical protein